MFNKKAIFIIFFSFLLVWCNKWNEDLLWIDKTSVSSEEKLKFKSELLDENRIKLLKDFTYDIGHIDYSTIVNDYQLAKKINEFTRENYSDEELSDLIKTSGKCSKIFRFKHKKQERRSYWWRISTDNFFYIWICLESEKYIESKWKNDRWLFDNYFEIWDLYNFTKEDLIPQENNSDNSEDVKKDKHISNDLEFIKTHYSDINKWNYLTAYNNYIKPKAKDLSTFKSWYSDTYDIKLSKIEKIWDREYSYYVKIYDKTDWVTVYKTDKKLKNVNWTIKIQWYWSTKINDYGNIKFN